MSKDQIIRAWKDQEYRNSLSPAQQARIPENPAGLIDLSDEEMQAAFGGADVDPGQGPYPLNTWVILCQEKPTIRILCQAR